MGSGEVEGVRQRREERLVTRWTPGRKSLGTCEQDLGSPALDANNVSSSWALGRGGPSPGFAHRPHGEQQGPQTAPHALPSPEGALTEALEGTALTRAGS